MISERDFILFFYFVLRKNERFTKIQIYFNNGQKVEQEELKKVENRTLK